MRRSTLVWTLVLAAWIRPAAAQNEVTAPRSYALTNARIIVAPGEVVDTGTVVVRDGRIVAAGANVQVPEGVISMDLDGASVYPGLIDAANATGLPAFAQGGGRGGGGGGEAAATESGPPPELSPARAAADAFSPGDETMSRFRAAGFTTVALAFNGGIFPGRVSVIDAKDGEAARAVIRSPAAQQVAFGRRRGGYPSTLMGALAYIEQSFKDARYDARVKAAFESSPGTAPLPEYDPEHDALLQAASGEMPVWFAASGAYDIERVIDLAERSGVTEYVIVGGQEGYQVATRLSASGRPAIVSLDYPEPGQVTGRSFELHVAPASGEDSAEEQADSAVARTLRGNVAALLDAGVPVALSGMGLSGPAQFRERILNLVEEGLPADEALRALTVTPAGVLGLGGALGTIEAGKLANLVVVDGDLFDGESELRYVFVEGERYEIPPAPEPGEGGGRGGRGGRGGGPGNAVAAGEWNGSMDMEGNAFPFTLTITGSGDALTATMGTEMGTTAMRGAQTDQDVVLRGMAETPEGQMAITITARIEGDEMTGTLDVEGMGSLPLTARRGGTRDHANEAIDGGNR